MMQVLLVEDNSGDVRLIREMLEDAGISKIRIVEAASLTEAASRLKSESFHVILLDLGLAESTGLRTLELAQKISGQVPIIVLTGLADEEAAVQAVARGAQDYFIKGEIDGGALNRAIHYAVERKKIEEKVRYQAGLIENVSDAIISTDAGFKIVSWNRAAELMYGWKADEVIGKPLKPYIRNEYPGTTEERTIADAFATGTWKGEVVQHRRDNSIINVLASVSAIKDGSGNIVGFVSINRDITELKQFERVLSESEEKYRLLSETSSDMIFAVDLDANVTYMNQSAMRTLEYETSDIGNLNFARLLPHELLPVFRRRKEARREGDRNAFRGELEFISKSGARIPVEVRGVPIIVDDRIVQVLLNARDITERRKAEAELRRANRALKTLSSCNEILVRATTENALLKEICSVIVEKGGYRMAWVGFAENDAEKSIRPVAYSGFEAGYLEKARITWDDSERGRGPSGKAVRTGRPAICRDITTDPALEPWRDDALRRGYLSSIVLPLKDGNSAFGSLSIYAAESDAFDSQEMDLLTKLAGDLSFGIVALRGKVELERARGELEERIDELERFNRLSVGREQRMIELKQKINELSVRLGASPPYSLAFLGQVEKAPGTEKKRKRNSH